MISEKSFTFGQSISLKVKGSHVHVLVIKNYDFKEHKFPQTVIKVVQANSFYGSISYK